jgi:cytochrome c5
MTESNNVLRWTAQTATLAYIAQELAKIDPLIGDDYHNTCHFCYATTFNGSPVIELKDHEENCAWRQAKEFVDG